MRRMRFLAITVLAMGLARGDFVAPAEGPVPFRRERLPIDVDTMGALSRDLVALAANHGGDGAERLRTVAQMAALALALDPANRHARELVEGWERGKSPSVPEVSAVGRGRSRSWNVLGWLRQPAAGRDGQALAGCLGDVLAISDPGHPGAAEWLAGGEQGQWKGWVAAREAFEAHPVAPPPEVPPAATVKVAAIQLATSSVPTLVWRRDPTNRQSSLVPATVTVRASVQAGARGLVAGLPGDPNGVFARQLAKPLAEFLEARHGKLPQGLQLSFALPEGLAFSRADNGDILSAVAYVLADAVFSGKPPAAAVLASVEPAGGLAPPERFWHTLRAIEPLPPGGRIVLPASTLELLPPLLALDAAELFMRHELLLASDAGMLCELASSEPPEPVVQAGVAFRSIRQDRGNRSLGSFLAASSIRQRLARIVEHCPQHASARMLALRGTSSWPKRLETADYAREIRYALDPMREAVTGEWISLKPAELDAAEDECRERLGKVERLAISVGDREKYYEGAFDTAKLLGDLADLIERPNPNNPTQGQVVAKATLAAYWSTVRRLTAVVGDADRYPLPAAP